MKLAPLDSMDISSMAPGLRLGRDGIWYSSGTATVSYPGNGNEVSFTVEDHSFWFSHRNACILALIRRFPPPGNGTIFDVGGGNGYVSKAIVEGGFPAVLVEPGPHGARNAQRRGIAHVVCATLEEAEFRPRSLTAVGLFDVIEHIEDDRGFLKVLHRLLLPGGMAYATVPAYSWLWSGEDDAAGHYRRYTLPQLRTRFEEAGFRVNFATYMFASLPLPIGLLRALPWRLGLRRNSAPKAAQREHEIAARWPMGRVVDGFLDFEINRISCLRALPFGGSCLIAASRG